MNFQKYLLSLVSLTTLVSCAVNPAKLNAPAVASSIYLDADREAMTTMPGLVTTYTLRKGIYESAKEDAKGTYYLGPESCFVTQLEVTQGTHRGSSNCGIFIPHDVNQTAIIFTIVGTNKVEQTVKPSDTKANTTGNIGTSPIAMAATNVAIKMESGQYELRIRKEDPLAKDLRSLVKLRVKPQ